MRVKNKKTYKLCRKTIVTDSEGGKYDGWSEPIDIKANIYPATGKLQAEMYGLRLNNIMNMLYDGSEELKEGDGICYTTYAISKNKPDYRVISIKPYSHKVIELEKII